MIDGMEIGLALFPALALAALIVRHVLTLPKPRRVPARIRQAQRRR